MEIHKNTLSFTIKRNNNSNSYDNRENKNSFENKNSYDKNYSDENDDNNPYKLITRRIDSTKIRHKQKRELQVNIVLSKELNFAKETPVRSGAIIYTKENDKTYFCLGIDTQSGNLTDFGGGVKKGETIIEGGLRELEEESQGVFGTIDPSDIEDKITFHCYNMAIMFIPIEVTSTTLRTRDEIYTEFTKRIEGNVDPEVCDIVWLDTQEFMESIHGRGRKLYIRVRKLLSRVTSAISEL